MSTDWNALRDEVHALARAKGWYDRERSETEARVLIVTEVAEAVEAYRDCALEEWYLHDKPCGVASELADVIIRALDLAGAKQVDAGVRRGPGWPIPDMWRGFDALMRNALDLDLGEVIDDALALGAFLGLDVEAAVLEKHAYNKSRAPRHGGKLA